MSDNPHACRLYLVVPADAGPDLVDLVDRALATGDVDAAVLRCADDGTVDRKRAAAVLEAAARHDVALLLESDIAAARATGADGVHVTGDEETYTAARDALGQEAIVGVHCPPERHIALTLAEAGADYVAFSQDRTSGNGHDVRDMLSWWAEIVEVPGVAWLAEANEEAQAFAQTGIEFVALSPAVWSAGSDPATALRTLRAALAATRSAA